MGSSDAVSWLVKYDAGQYKPVTFLDRGVTLPFTTPALLGGRIRPGDRRQAELILSNPAGVEGVYILPWSAMPDICSPTLHDRALWVRVSQMPQLTPRTVREATRMVAADGHAGRTAARAAAEVTLATRNARTLTQYYLLLELVRQGEPAGLGLPPPERDDPTSVERRARAVLHRRRNEAGLSPAAAFETLAELAEVFEPCGLIRDPTKARLPRLASDIGVVIQDLNHWSETADPIDRICSRLLAHSAALTLRCVKVALADTHALLDDLWGLLLRWQLDPEPIQLQAARPEWLLDGWDLICGLWRGSPADRRSGAALDMANLVPVIPAEVGEWVGFDAPGDMDTHQSGLRRWRRTVQPNQDWVTGRMLEQTARNEALRARCA
jgi:hypothetical protein